MHDDTADSPQDGRQSAELLSQKTLLEYARELLELGQSQFELQYQKPVLVQTADTDDDTSLNFKTAFMAPSAAGARRGVRPASHLCPIWQVEKRSDGAFQERIGVGRTRNADVWIPSQKVSKYHAYFTLREDGSVELTDAGSKNGTFVAGKRLPARETTLVPFGSEVRFGPCRFLLESPATFLDLVGEEANRISR